MEEFLALLIAQALLLLAERIVRGAFGWTPWARPA